MELNSTDNEKIQSAYSTQFFEFTPDAFIDSVTTPALDVVKEHLDAAKERIASEFVGKVNEKDLEEAFSVIKGTYESHTTEVFDKFACYLKKNIFNIPKDVTLPEDRPHLTSEAKRYNGQELEKELKELEKMIKEVTDYMYRYVNSKFRHLPPLLGISRVCM